MDKAELGICVKTIDKEVVDQNELCLKVCGNMKGEVCTKGCMTSYFTAPGMTLMKNSHVEGSIVDAVIINNGKELTTLIYPNINTEDHLQIESSKLLSYNLSKSEAIIFSKVLEGKKNTQIIKELFISKSTLKTHLNNIYKKLPESYQQYKNRR